MKELRKRLAFLRRSDGMTIVNVMVAFVVLLILLAAFLQVTNLSRNLVTKADQVRTETNDVLEQYYLGSLDGKSTETTFTLTDGESSFVLPAAVEQYTSGSMTITAFADGRDGG